MDVARYILNNPVRAGIVGDVRDYSFAGSLKYPLEAILERVSDPTSA